jgi:hypothetical protein
VTQLIFSLFPSPIAILEEFMGDGRLADVLAQPNRMGNRDGILARLTEDEKLIGSGVVAKRRVLDKLPMSQRFRHGPVPYRKRFFPNHISTYPIPSNRLAESDDIAGEVECISASIGPIAGNVHRMDCSNPSRHSYPKQLLNAKAIVQHEFLV